MATVLLQGGCGGDVADTTKRATVCSMLMAVCGVRLATFLLRRQSLPLVRAQDNFAILSLVPWGV